MDWSLLWKAVIIVLGGTILLRIAGRKSISQMTLIQVVIMVGIGSLLVQPIVGKDVWATLAVGLALVLTLVALEFLQVKFDIIERFITSRAKILIENGKVNEKNLRKVRLTVDQIEMQLRQKNVTNLEDVHFATLEPNGQLGFTLKQGKQPATKEDIQQVLSELNYLRSEIREKYPQTKVVYKSSHLEGEMPSNTKLSNQNKNQFGLFEEVTEKGHMQTPPEHLQ